MQHKIIITSKNPVKVNSVKSAFEKMFPNKTFIYETINVSSDVSNQPLSDKETLQGAINRVNNASKEIKADYYVGIEGGIKKDESFAWIVIKNKDKISKSRTATFTLPKKIIEMINQGIEMGEANDLLFNLFNSKQKNGTVGLLTNNLINRTSYCEHAVILALIPFKNEKLY